jgi:hypothetical protein
VSLIISVGFNYMSVKGPAVVGMYTLQQLTRSSKAPGFKPWNLKCDHLVSNFAFKSNLYRYTAGGGARDSNMRSEVKAAIASMTRA